VLAHALREVKGRQLLALGDRWRRAAAAEQLASSQAAIAAAQLAAASAINKL
jgi:hypothetical protein